MGSVLTMEQGKLSVLILVLALCIIHIHQPSHVLSQPSSCPAHLEHVFTKPLLHITIYIATVSLQFKHLLVLVAALVHEHVENEALYAVVRRWAYCSFWAQHSLSHRRTGPLFERLHSRIALYLLRGVCKLDALANVSSQGRCSSINCHFIPTIVCHRITTASINILHMHIILPTQTATVVSTNSGVMGPCRSKHRVHSRLRPLTARMGPALSLIVA